MEQHPQGLRGIGLSHCQESPEQKVLAVSGTGGLEVGEGLGEGKYRVPGQSGEKCLHGLPLISPEGGQGRGARGRSRC